MGQRSQIYIRYDIEHTGLGSGHSKGLIARYYQWNYGERMISRARGIIEHIKDEFLEYPFMWNHKHYLEKLRRICDVNFDMRDIVMSMDIIKEVTEEWNGNCAYIFDQDNNDGQLLIDVTNDGIKYCFVSPYEDVKPMDGRQYLIWDGQDNYDECKWTETEIPDLDKETIVYTLDNIKFISENAKLMTKKEAEEFVGADYSYLFAPGF